MLTGFVRNNWRGGFSLVKLFLQEVLYLKYLNYITTSITLTYFHHNPVQCLMKIINLVLYITFAYSNTEPAPYSYPLSPARGFVPGGSVCEP